MAVNEPPAMGTGRAVLMTAGILVLLAGFLGIGPALGLVPLYTALLLLWYFGSVDEFTGAPSSRA
ncbi:hypothetical protein GCM10011529_24500 [Polymorphobacter glacialis]|uniref:Uncharacterized protein n=1 Tax=Sandarakinorhabdus glacialis TaxID=1614636 RepID=A0A916ZWN8_9SPHN|nr:hypothetical protein [Polymorphobacter glacialis]GGE17121.1 hypothetical protein GCM10011529_24500 [Polymorphobacter glacialis]